MNRLLILFISLACCQFSSAQIIGAWDIDEHQLKPWKSENVKEYEGIYHFAEGDGSELRVIVNNGKVTAQIVNSDYWSEGGYALSSGAITKDSLTIKYPYLTLADVLIKDGEFISKQHKGEFVIFRNPEDSTKIYPGLKIDNSWNSYVRKLGKYEVGLRTDDSLIVRYPGRFPSSSLRPWDSKELLKYSLEDLQEMRNEIFARYGFKFREGGTIREHFKGMKWYHARYKSVDKYLTDIELNNIEKIKSAEKNAALKVLKPTDINSIKVESPEPAIPVENWGNTLGNRRLLVPGYIPWYCDSSGSVFIKIVVNPKGDVIEMDYAGGSNYACHKSKAFEACRDSKYEAIEGLTKNQVGVREIVFEKKN